MPTANPDADQNALLFPVAPIFDQGWLDVGAGHRIYFVQRGNPQGIPAVSVHGGPGSGSSPMQSRFFDPARYRIIQFDQRGCGQSEPAGQTINNQTADLLFDMEKLRRHNAIDRWLVVGGSWGATLAAVYAAEYPAQVSGVLLRGLFLTSDNDLRWFFHDAKTLHPAAWENFARHASPPARDNLLPWLHQVFSLERSATQAEVALAWHNWERTLSGLAPSDSSATAELDALCRRYRIQTHYLSHECWLGKASVLEACTKLLSFPVSILHGDNDQICQPDNSRAAHQACKESKLKWAAGAGHDPFHPEMVRLMRHSLDQFAHTGSF